MEKKWWREIWKNKCVKKRIKSQVQLENEEGRQRGKWKKIKHKVEAVEGNQKSSNHKQHNVSPNMHYRSKYSMCADCRKQHISPATALVDVITMPVWKCRWELLNTCQACCAAMENWCLFVAQNTGYLMCFWTPSDYSLTNYTRHFHYSTRCAGCACSTPCNILVMELTKS